MELREKAAREVFARSGFWLSRAECLALADAVITTVREHDALAPYVRMRTMLSSERAARFSGNFGQLPEDREADVDEAEQGRP
jgi:hypothetical protein